MLNFKTKYSYNDIALIPNAISNIEHREECIPYKEDGYLPLFTAPMSCVVDDVNYKEFKENKIHPIIPRNISYDNRIKLFLEENWVAFSLKEFEELFCLKKIPNFNIGFALIDIANGHMKKLFDLVKTAKINYDDNLKIMIGNIANPQTYKEALKANVDYIRLGIGGGRGCITSSNTSIHFPMASLIYETNNLRRKLAKKYLLDIESMPKIIADGGIRNYSDIIKAIALGADYVMCGYIFSKMYESSGLHVINFKIPDAELLIKDIYNLSLNDNEERKKMLCKSNLIRKDFYGMSTKKAQAEIGVNQTLKTSEGIETMIDIEYTMKGWIENFIHYLRSAMSYSNSKTLSDFVKKSKIIIISNNTYNSVNK